jgi:protein phosphatase 1 regulatory subunit 7
LLYLQTNLTTVDLAGNRIANIPSSLAPLTQLEDLWLNDNQVAHYADVEHLVPLAGLRTLYLERNPLAQDFEYRKKLEELLPALDQIDATPTTKARQGRM